MAPAKKKPAPLKLQAAPDPTVYLLEAVQNHPGEFRELRIFRIEVTTTQGSGAPVHKRRAALGSHSLESLLNPGLDATLANCYGGTPDGAGTPYDCQLIRSDGTMGPCRRVWCAYDARPAHQRQQPPGWAPQQQQQPQQQPWGPPPWGPPPWQQQQQQPWGPPPWQQQQQPQSDPMMLMMMQHMLAQSTTASDAAKNGVQQGMELAREIAAATTGGATPQEIAAAVTSSVAGITESIIKAKAAAAFVPPSVTTTKEPIAVDDPSHIGWIIEMSLTQDWPAASTLRTITGAVGADRMAALQADPLQLQEIFKAAASAHPPLMPLLEDQARIATWIQGLVDEMHQ